MKISYLEKENLKLIRKMSNENKKSIIEKLKKNDFLEDIYNKKNENQDKKENIKEKKEEEFKKENKEEVNKENNDNLIKNNSNFKIPEIKQKNYEEEGEWKVIRKKQKRKKQ
jgi:hypothetical protein